MLLALHGEWHAQEPGETPAGGCAGQYRACSGAGPAAGGSAGSAAPSGATGPGLQLRLVLALNRQYRYPANADALQIAVYWHDVGCSPSPMRRLQHHPLQKAEDWSDYARASQLAASWLLSIAPIAAKRRRLSASIMPGPMAKALLRRAMHLPHPGSQLLACADLWFERIKGLSGEGLPAEALRALFDINGLLDSQFDALLINAFAAVAADFQPRA